MPMAKQIKLSAFLIGAGQHLGGWRHPEAPSDGNTNFELFRKLARTAERGLFDALFLADNLTVIPGSAQGGSARIVGYEPVTLFSALASVTERIGFIATASTTYEEPFSLARKFASLDLLSNGRAGWNVVTSAGDDTAQNFNRDAQAPHGERYSRAREHVAVVKALWESWEDDAFIRDKESGVFYDPRKMHAIDHRGAHYQVRGPLNVPRSLQGHPVIVQAGQSEDGRSFAAETAEIVFTVQRDIDSARAFYGDVKARARAHGRDPDHVLIMPGIAPIVGRTDEEAAERFEFLNNLIRPEDGIALLNRLNGGTIDFGKFPLDGPLPQSERTEGQRGRQDLIYSLSESGVLTIRQVYQRIASARGHYTIVGSAKTIADNLEEWFSSGAADGFNIMPPWVPGTLEDFVDLVIPELQRRGLYRAIYEGRTLRASLGLPYPTGRHEPA